MSNNIDYFIFNNGCYHTLSSALEAGKPLLKHKWVTDCQSQKKLLDFKSNPNYSYTSLEAAEEMAKKKDSKNVRRQREDIIDVYRKKRLSMHKEKKKRTKPGINGVDNEEEKEDIGEILDIFENIEGLGSPKQTFKKNKRTKKPDDGIDNEDSNSLKGTKEVKMK